MKIDKRVQKKINFDEIPTSKIIKEATKHFSKGGEMEDESVVSKNVVEDVQKKFENLIQSFFGNNNNNEQPQEPQTQTQPQEEIPIPNVDQDSLENLVSIGFPEVACKKALILTNGNCEEALEWMLQHSGDEDFNQPITQRQLRGLGLGDKRKNTNGIYLIYLK